MTAREWLACTKPDELLDALLGKVGRDQLVEFVRRCWRRIEPHIEAPPYEVTVVDQYAEAAPHLNDMDAARYAYEAALKAAGWAPDMLAEQAAQAELLRQIVAYPGAVTPVRP
jgi:hypothetical protein